jgi:predicted kinase
MENQAPYTFDFTATHPLLDWEALNALDWVRDLKDVPQSPIHHAEGDVWIHTKMVMEALLGIAEYQTLPSSEREMLFWATLAHDICKPDCTEIDHHGNITSPRHAVKGRGRIRREIFQGNPGPFPFAEREAIAQLVRYHGLPLWFLEKPNLQAEVLKASQLCDLRLLALLAEADVRGRICADQAELLERVEFFREYCREQDVFGKPWTFVNGHQRFEYFRHPENGPQYLPFDNFKSEVILLSGLPGAGKDTWIKTQGPDWPVISLDQMREELDIAPTENQGRIIAESKERAKVFLRKGQSFIWNATNIVPSVRHQLIDLFHTYKARTKIVYVESPYAVMHAQNAGREARVPATAMAHMLRKWEVPECWEAVDVEYAVR